VVSERLLSVCSGAEGSGSIQFQADDTDDTSSEAAPEEVSVSPSKRPRPTEVKASPAKKTRTDSLPALPVDLDVWTASETSEELLRPSETNLRSRAVPLATGIDSDLLGAAHILFLSASRGRKDKSNSQ